MALGRKSQYALTAAWLLTMGWLLQAALVALQDQFGTWMAAILAIYGGLVGAHTATDMKNGARQDPTN